MLSTQASNRKCLSSLLNLVIKAKYSRRSDKTDLYYQVLKSADTCLSSVDNGVLAVNQNWELLAPSGFRFYMPGSVGPGWVDPLTMVPAKVHALNSLTGDTANEMKTEQSRSGFPVLHVAAQECPMLLRKYIKALFPGYTEIRTSRFSIITMAQEINPKSTRWSKEAEVEKLTKYFVLAASEICMKLKAHGFWADFINPFSGKPYLNPHAYKNLYKTDRRFRCLGFKIDAKNNCKVISHEDSSKYFTGSLYTTAPPNTDFLKGLVNDVDVQ